ncbi:MAG: glutaredoxin family protein [Candidatus Thorarchaeota archaeon]|jgi:glutaredoxin-like YruB-family protein
MKNVTIYSTPTCAWCKRTKDFMNERKIKFNDIDVSTDQKAAHEMLHKSGQMSVPVIDINGKLIIGFDVDAINRALGV